MASSLEILNDDSETTVEAPIVQQPQVEDEDSLTALNVELVLRKVFSFLQQDDLKQCRLVNRFWDGVAVPYLKRVCCYISFNDDNYWTNMKNHGIDDMAEFTKCANASANFPFVKLDLGTSVVKTKEHEKVLRDFLQTVCPWVVQLTIRDEWGQQLFPDGLPEKFEFPCLHVLRVHFLQPMNNGEDISANFQFITEILENSVSLKKVLLIDHNGMDDGKVVSFFLDSIEKSKSAKKISQLEIEAQIENHHLSQLTGMGLQLKLLHLDFWGSLISEDKLKSFLASQSNTLEQFKIADFSMSSDFVVDFPCMKTLKSLMIKGSLLGRICVTFPNVSYVKQFPVLKRLSFSNAMEEWDEFLKFGIQPVETVEELKLPGDFTDEVSLRHAAHIFPKIKKLEIPAFLNIANIVYSSMPNIEELILNTKYVDSVDDVITGLTLEVCEEVRTFPEDMFRIILKDHMKLITTSPISSLQRLKILRLKCKRQSDPVELSDVSCRLVLMKMQSLQCLDLWKRLPTHHRISPRILRNMKKQFVVLY